MGLPEILIEFKTIATTAIQRSQRGIVALILKNTGEFDTKTYKAIDEIDADDWSADNLDYIKKAFLGIPSMVICERVPVDAVDYNAALTRLNSKIFNYLAIPGILTAEVAAVATWLKSARDNGKKTFKAVLPNNTADHEGIINFATGGIVVGVKTYTAAEYCARITGILAGLPFTRSSTFFVLSEVEAITESADPDTDINEGKLILINDGKQIKIARGVNSLTTTSTSKGAIFKKIKIVDAVDLVTDDIRNTWADSYVGKVLNSYDNKILFLGAVNAYFAGLERFDILDPNSNNVAEIDVEAQRIYLQSIGVDIEALTEQEIKEYNTNDKVFSKASVKFLDAMEDLAFAISI